MQIVFNKPYDEVSEVDLHIFAENLIERTYLLKKYLPKKLGFILKGIFTHPKLNTLDKNNLTAILELHNLKLEIHHSPLVSMHDFNIGGVKVPEDSLFEIDQVKERVKKARIPFVENIANKIMSVNV